MCDECRRIEAKDYWRACVQVRQKCDFKKTLFYLEQLLLKHNAHSNTTTIKPSPTGIDFYYAKQQDARKLVDFINTILPCKYQTSQASWDLFWNREPKSWKFHFPMILVLDSEIVPQVVFYFSYLKILDTCYTRYKKQRV